MQNTLQTFVRIAQNLLDDESRQPVADFIPAQELFDSLDLALNEEPMSEQNFETALESLVLKSPRTATVGFFNQLFGDRRVLPTANPRPLLPLPTFQQTQAQTPHYQSLRPNF